MFKGKMTYTVGVSAILGALGGLLQGSLSVAEAAPVVVMSLIGIFLRRGLKTDLKTGPNGPSRENSE